ncbi:MAG: hypothetical protein LBR55_01325 [Bacteroidales bacterium]|jgi:hypothetical protein|nr:hypothetical protein [Bacteroidales bacterium]
MKNHYFSIPTTLELTEEKNWKNGDEKKTSFYIVRFHFMVKVREIEDCTRNGEIIAVLQSPKGATQERTATKCIEKEYINFDETFTSCIVETEDLEQITNDILIGGDIISVAKINLKNNLTRKIKESVHNTFKSGNTIRESKTITYETKIKFDKNSTEKIYQITQYQKSAFDMYLTFIDYLKVDYKTSFLGLRKKRVKEPRIQENGKKINVLKINAPLASVHFWKLIEDTSVYRKETEYKNEVPTPNERIVFEPEDLNQYYVEIPKQVLSLYRLSNVAFPIKWIERKCNKTKEDLMKVEEDDYYDRWKIK